MPRFEKKYTDDEFMNALSFFHLRTTSYVMRKLGCDRKTAKIYLDRLASERKVKKFEVDDGQSYVWLRLYDEIKDIPENELPNLQHKRCKN